MAELDIRTGVTIGEYVVEGLLGKGAFGDVYRASQPVIGKRVAIKVLKPQFSADPDMVSRFQAEARAVNRIGHRNIIDIFSFSQLGDGRHYYVMELLTGVTLERYLRERTKLSLADALVILRQVGRALDAAHAKGIAHRDLKPDNIFIAFDDGKPYPKLLDFGIAKLMRDQRVSHKTLTGAPMGTPHYMSPEQCRGRAVDHRTDIYAFGVMTYQLLTGTLPFIGEDVLEISNLQVSATATPPSQLVPELSPEVDAAIAEMMAKAPADRPPSLAAAVAKLAGEPVPEPVASPSSVPPEPVDAGAPTVPGTSPPSEPPPLSHIAAEVATERTKKRPWMALALVLGTLAAIGVVAVYLSRDKSEAPVVKDPVPVTPAPVIREQPLIVDHWIDASVDAAPVVDAALAPVAIRIQATPRTLQLFADDGTPVAIVDGAIALPRGERSLHFVAKAPGYERQDVSIVPNRDHPVTVTLVKVRVPTTAPAAGSGSATKPPTNPTTSVPGFDESP